MHACGVHVWCIDVFCDVAGGELVAKRPTDEDWLTRHAPLQASARNLRRTCSHYEPGARVSRLEEMTANDVQMTSNDDDDDDDDDDVEGDAGAAGGGTAETHPDSQQKMRAVSQLVSDVHRMRVVAATTDNEQWPSTAFTHSDVAEQSTQLHAKSSFGCARSPAARGPPTVLQPAAVVTSRDVKRPAPPVSRVKPMIRQQPEMSTEPAGDTATAHAQSGRRPVPVPAERHRPKTTTLDTVEDIPSDVSSLSSAELARCAVLIGVLPEYANQLVKHRIDGQQLTKLTASQLTEMYNFTPLDANKLARFGRGWRPA